jgi:hypothetical protein
MRGTSCTHEDVFRIAVGKSAKKWLPGRPCYRRENNKKINICEDVE